MYIKSNASDTDVMVLAISAIEKLRGNTSIIEGTGPRRRIVKLQPIYDALGENKVQAIGGCDTTGHIFETSKTWWWKFFFKSNDSVIGSLTALGTNKRSVWRVWGINLPSAESKKRNIYYREGATVACILRSRLVVHYDNLVTDFDTDNVCTWSGVCRCHSCVCNRGDTR